eukprot:COSAG04_NODE_646_length_11599_cov_28.808435_4_plen_117_part_00
MSDKPFPYGETFIEKVKIHVTADGESIRSVTAKHGADEGAMLTLCKSRIAFPRLSVNTKLSAKTALLVPDTGETTWTIDQHAIDGSMPAFGCSTKVRGLAASAGGLLRLDCCAGQT